MKLSSCVTQFFLMLFRPFLMKLIESWKLECGCRMYDQKKVRWKKHVSRVGTVELDLTGHRQRA